MSRYTKKTQLESEVMATLHEPGLWHHVGDASMMILL